MLDEFNKVFKTQNDIIQIQKARIETLKEQLKIKENLYSKVLKERDDLDMALYEISINYSAHSPEVRGLAAQNAILKMKIKSLQEENEELNKIVDEIALNGN